MKSFQKFNLNEIGERFTETWSPQDVERIDNFVLRAAKFEGEYHWHTHDNTDELFIVFKGKIKVQTRAENFILGVGEGVKIPKGVEHCPAALESSIVLMFEPADLKSKGD